MQTNTKLLRAATLVVAAIPTGASAVWVCHGPEGITWQQEYPPCQMPGEVADEIQRKRQRRTEQPAQVVQPVQARPKVAPPQDSPPDEYQRTVAGIEKRHPELNPDSPLFRRDLEQQVVVHMATLRKQGLGPTAALEAAVPYVIEANSSAQAGVRQQVPAQTQKMDATPKSPLSDSDRLINSFVGGAGGAALIVGGLALIGALLRALLNGGRRAARATSSIIENTSAVDIARAAGQVTGSIERKSKPLLEAFRKGRSNKD